ncbi:MAG: M20/M25/M40 family metallo-hydrolase [Polyangia bacterium]
MNLRSGGRTAARGRGAGVLLVATLALSGRAEAPAALAAPPMARSAAASDTAPGPRPAKGTATAPAASQAAPPGTAAIDLSRHRGLAVKLINALARDPRPYQRLAYLCDTFGPRLSGSAGLERALDWILGEMQRDGLAPRAEPVQVPRWVRGAESLTLLSPREARLAVLGLGEGAATPPEGLTAEVLAVRSFDELAARADEARGKIVLYAIPFDDYEHKYIYRAQGAIKAAQVGAVGVLLRSLTPQSLYTPHTGAMRYDPALPRLPAAAVTPEDAEMLWRMGQRGQKPRVTLKLEAQKLSPAPSRNVLAELRGSERPDEIVAFGCHSDSWDVGQGAQDDGGNCVAAWHALLSLKELGLRPRRTVRLVLWVNEENGMAGAKAYAEAHAKEPHLFALEADSGVFRPLGLTFTGPETVRARLQAILGLLEPLGATLLTAPGGGVDILPLEERGVPVAGLKVAGERYFLYHHSAADTVDKVDPQELNQVAAALAVVVLGVADLL